MNKTKQCAKTVSWGVMEGGKRLGWWVCFVVVVVFFFLSFPCYTGSPGGGVPFGLLIKCFAYSMFSSNQNTQEVKKNAI